MEPNCPVWGQRPVNIYIPRRSSIYIRTGVAEKRARDSPRQLPQQRTRLSLGNRNPQLVFAGLLHQPRHRHSNAHTPVHAGRTGSRHQYCLPGTGWPVLGGVLLSLSPAPRHTQARCPLLLASHLLPSSGLREVHSSCLGAGARLRGLGSRLDQPLCSAPGLASFPRGEGCRRKGAESFREGCWTALLSTCCFLPTDIITVCPFRDALPEGLKRRAPPG